MGPRYDPTQRPWYQHGANANGETVRTNAYYWAADDTVIVSTVKAVKEGGQVVGVQGMDVSLKALTDMVKKITLGESGYLMLVEDSGTVLVNLRIRSIILNNSPKSATALLANWRKAVMATLK